MAAESWKHLYEKNNFCHPVTLAWFSIQILGSHAKNSLFGDQSGEFGRYWGFKGVDRANSDLHFREVSFWNS